MKMHADIELYAACGPSSYKNFLHNGNLAIILENILKTLLKTQETSFLILNWSRGSNGVSIRINQNSTATDLTEESVKANF